MSIHFPTHCRLVMGPARCRLCRLPVARLGTLMRRLAAGSRVLLLGLGLGVGMAARAAAPLADLIEAGDTRAALALLTVGAEVNAAQPDGSTALLWAVYHVDEALVAALLQREADPDLGNRFGATPLAEAAKLGHAGLVRQLLEAGAAPDSANADGQTPLMLVAGNGSLASAEALLAAGANVNAVEQWTGQTALMWAAAGRHADMVALLVAHGAAVNARATAFDWSSQITSEPRGQYRPAGGLTPLLYAARSGCLACVETLLQAGADPDLPTPEGVTPLLSAIESTEFGIANRLLDAGADPHSFDWWGRTPLYLAIDVRSIASRGQQLDRARRDLALRLAERLLAAGVYVDPQMNFHRPGPGGGNGRYADELLTTGTTPLLRAAVGHDAEAARLLLQHGARVDLPNIFGITPLIAVAGIATPRGLLSDGSVFPEPDIEDLVIATLDVLLEAGADINAVITDTTSYTAEWPRHASISNRQGQTAIYGPGKWGWLRVAEYLVEHGARTDVVDFYGKTPVDSALAKAGGEQEETYPALAAYLEARR